ncbi:MAG: L-threonine 3-dehydrogenase [Bacillota bacterium]|nr:L-threonine 3-dehydrogenase [Bacillota bacterium]
MKRKMKALIKEKAGPGAAIIHMDIPEPGPHDVLIKVLAASICGTDLHIYNWDKWAASRIKPPVVIGHEMSGNIVKVGSGVKTWHEGDYVSLECHKTCGQCYQCRTGQAHICRDYSILGVDIDGCFAEYVRVPETNLWKNDRIIPPEIACLQDPVGNAVMAVASVDITGKTVMIAGCGSIGLFAVGVARVLGASKVYAVDINDYRLKIAQKMGSTSSINPLRQNLLEEVMLGTRGEGVDLVVEVSGNEQCLLDALKTLKHGGRIALLGIPQEKIYLDLANDVIFKGIILAGITGREIFSTWYKTSALLKSVLDISQVITHRMRLEQYEEAFRIMQLGECGKIILYPD